jgi:hypothetical protein
LARSGRILQVRNSLFIPAFISAVLFAGPEYVSAREWMRICFELLELLKAHKKAIRRATVNTFGYIAKAIG